MPETTPEAEPLDAEAAYKDSKSVPLSEAWRLIDPPPALQDRMEAVKSHLRTAILAVVAMPYPPRPGDKPMLLPRELVHRALEHPTLRLLLPADDLVTGNPRHGGLEFSMCRAILAVHVAVFETLAEWKDAAHDSFGDDEIPPVTLPRLIEVLATLFIEDRAWEKAGDESLGRTVAGRDARFRPNLGAPKVGRWNKNTLKNRIKLARPDAKVLAAERRHSDS